MNKSDKKMSEMTYQELCELAQSVEVLPKGLAKLVSKRSPLRRSLTSQRIGVVGISTTESIFHLPRKKGKYLSE